MLVVTVTLWLFAGWLAAPMQGTAATASCEDITGGPLCGISAIDYTQTSMPNSLGHLTQHDASIYIMQYYNFVKVQCSPYLETFLCALYKPRCIQANSSQALLPCRELCEEVKSGCLPLMLKFPFDWPEDFLCEKFPSQEAGQECYSGDFVGVPPFNSNVPKEQGSCEPITVKICSGSGVLHSQTRFPISIPFGPGPEDVLHYQTQREAFNELDPYTTLLSRGGGCMEFFKPLVCAVYLPPCNTARESVHLCRDLCEHARSKCRLSMLRLGLHWPKTLDCRRFPTETENPKCLSALSVGEVEVSASNVSATVRVRCTFGLASAIQPQWLTPDDTPVTKGDERIFAITPDKHITTLVIEDFSDSVDSGDYTCTAGDFTGSVTLADIFEPTPDKVAVKCTTDEFLCDNKECIVKTLVCDQNEDCADGSDETKELCKNPSSDCTSDEHTCQSGGCLSALAWCDDKFDCADNSDEQNCTLGLIVAAANVSQISSTRIDVIVECSSLYLYHSVQEQPAWITPDGITIEIGSALKNVHVEYINDFTSLLVIEGYTDELNEGNYICGVSFYAKSSSLYDLNPKQVGEACEEIRVPACRSGIGYSSTYVPSLIGLSQDAVIDLMGGFTVILDNACSSYFRPYMCSLYLPPCGDKAILPCQELCLKAVNDCAKSLSGAFSETEVINLRESCASMPSETDSTSECFNVNEVSIGELGGYTLDGLTHKSIDCTYNLLPAFQPRWFTPYGEEVSNDYFSGIHVWHVSDTVTTLNIRNFTNNDSGSYVCTGFQPDSATTIAIGDINQGPDGSTGPGGTYVPDKPQCEEIRIPECTKGIGYSSAYFPSPLVQNQDDLLSIFAVFTSFFNAACSPYFRPFICSLYLPPCGEQFLPPCKELCLTAASECEENLGSDQGQVIEVMRKSCDDLPSKTNPSRQCYDVKEVEVGAIKGLELEDSEEYYVECTYNLLPAFQPTWFAPDGSEISGSSSTRVSSIKISPSVSQLYIRDYDGTVDGGTYTCHGQDQMVTVDL